MRLINIEILVSVCVLLGLMACNSFAIEIIYVDLDANGTNDGSSWADAYKYLQDVLSDAKGAPKPVEIRVAAGIYKPDRGGGITPGDREATFQLINGVAIKGGYAGFDQPEPNERDIRVYETILSGDLDGNDADVNELSDLLNDPNRGENSYSVVTGSRTDSTALLDGVTITGGNANVGYLSPYGNGGGMYNDNGSPTLTNCTFRGNLAGGGAGVHNWLSSPMIAQCTFHINASSFNGGGMLNMNLSRPTVTGCTFTANLAGAAGGGMGNCQNSASLVVNCVFVDNIANVQGGGMRNRDSSPTITSCTFSRNWSAQNGGGIHCGGSSNPAVINCILWANTDSSGGESAQIYVEQSAGVTVNYCCIEGWTGAFDGTGNIGADPCFFNPNAGDFHLSVGSACIDKGDNSALPPGTTTDQDGNPRIIDGDCNSEAIVDMGAYEYNWFGIGDFNNDCNVNLIDFSIFANYWGSDESFVDIAPPGGDRIVNFLDLAIITDHWLE